MAHINESQRHSLSVSDAKKKAKKLVAGLSDKGVKLKGSWSGNTYSFSGTGIKSGTVNVGSNKISVEVTLSLLGRPLKGKATAEIKKALREEFR